MAEAEDLITDAARHATVFVRELWLRRAAPPDTAKLPALADVSQRLDILITAVFGTGYVIRIAQPPPPPRFLTKLFERHDRPRVQQAIPATDGASIWLPSCLPLSDRETALERFRTMALIQAARARRGSAQRHLDEFTPLHRDLYLLLEAHAADEELARMLPGMQGAVTALRRAALVARPDINEFPWPRRPIETLLRSVLQAPCGRAPDDFPLTSAPAESAIVAQLLAAQLAPDGMAGGSPLFKDLWTGDLRPATAAGMALGEGQRPDENEKGDGDQGTPRSARLSRRPEVREPVEDEDDDEPGPWMIQSAQPEEHVEDPMGAQRPTDRDDRTAAEEFADSMSELPEARLVSAPGRPKEVLLSDDPPEARSRSDAAIAAEGGSRISYPEWDVRISAYREAAATVRLVRGEAGTQAWVDRTLSEHRSMLSAIRRRFEMLRAERVRLRKQRDGDELDLQAYTDGFADFRAGLAMNDGFYEIRRPARRSMAIALLIDVSGSTDGWVSAHRRVIDVEREALLLVCIALEGLAEPYSVHAFSGEGPHNVTVDEIKRFDEHYDNEVALRIAALEPERYTRAGAAVRHVSALLMRQAAEHRLLLLLSDGKPNDVDQYDGRYGVEDMRQAIVEARLQGMSPFCLTIDRQAANYLPALFGRQNYAMLPRPELLPTVLLEWLRRLVAG